MKIAVACDHGGYRLKNVLMEEMKKQGYEVVDFGTYNEESCDYPDYAAKAAKAVANGECEKGVVVCGTGIGMSIAANKVHGVRAALCGDTYSARVSRAHNNANILCLGERVIGEHLALDIVDIWLKTGFEGGRHKRRLDMIE